MKTSSSSLIFFLHKKHFSRKQPNWANSSHFRSTKTWSELPIEKIEGRWSTDDLFRTICGWFISGSIIWIDWFNCEFLREESRTDQRISDSKIEPPERMEVSPEVDDRRIADLLPAINERNGDKKSIEVIRVRVYAKESKGKWRWRKM